MFVPATRGKNFNEALLKGLSADLPDIVLVKRAPPPKTSQSKVKTANKCCLRHNRYNGNSYHTYIAVLFLLVFVCVGRLLRFFREALA